MITNYSVIIRYKHQIPDEFVFFSINRVTEFIEMLLNQDEKREKITWTYEIKVNKIDEKGGK